jgi:hypothetical protein
MQLIDNPLHCKKRLAIFPSPAGRDVPNQTLPRPGIIHKLKTDHDTTAGRLDSSHVKSSIVEEQILWCVFVPSIVEERILRFVFVPSIVEEQILCFVFVPSIVEEQILCFVFVPSIV